MKHASIVLRKHRNNTIFEANERDNFGGWFFPFQRLREAFRAVGIEVSTVDMNVGREVLFELHINVQRRSLDVPLYCYNYEHPDVRAINVDPLLLSRYRQVWTWNESLVDHVHIQRLPIPNDLAPRPLPGFAERELFCVMIASNKALLHPNPRNLHAARVAVIREFENKAPDQFHLYGHGWGIPPVRPGHWGRLKKRLNEWRRHLTPNWRPFPSYRGTLTNKTEVLERAKFSICYENLRGGQGYITEKIFDCWINGCLPVYVGASNIAQCVPPECYIDGDRFDSMTELIDYLERIDEGEFALRQQAAQAFMRSEAGQCYDQAHFCRTIVDGILRDLGVGDALTSNQQSTI